MLLLGDLLLFLLLTIDAMKRRYALIQISWVLFSPMNTSSMGNPDTKRPIETESRIPSS
jgi:hypothetical protein